jgi:hypothetical protein
MLATKLRTMARLTTNSNVEALSQYCLKAMDYYFSFFACSLMIKLHSSKISIPCDLILHFTMLNDTIITSFPLNVEDHKRKL